MRRILFSFLLLLPSVAIAGFPFEATLEEMATSADHILVGRVTGVDMIDGSGKPVRDLEARTGPSLKNQIRLRISVDEVLVSNAKTVPKILFVPLASHLHYSFGQIKAAHSQDSEQRLILLRGQSFEGIKPGVFMRPLEEEEEALRLRKAHQQQLRPGDATRPTPPPGSA